MHLFYPLRLFIRISDIQEYFAFSEAILRSKEVLLWLWNELIAAIFLLIRIQTDYWIVL